MTAKKVVPKTSEQLQVIAMEALREVAEDKDAPAAARAAASRTILETLGALGRNQDLSRLDERRSLAEMSPAEINEEITRLAKKLPKPKLTKLNLG